VTSRAKPLRRTVAGGRISALTGQTAGPTCRRGAPRRRWPAEVRDCSRPPRHRDGSRPGRRTQAGKEWLARATRARSSEIAGGAGERVEGRGQVARRARPCRRTLLSQPRSPPMLGAAVARGSEFAAPGLAAVLGSDHHADAHRAVSDTPGRFVTAHNDHHAATVAPRAPRTPDRRTRERGPRRLRGPAKRPQRRPLAYELVAESPPRWRRSCVRVRPPTRHRRAPAKPR
jgi:hypothetical protein